LSVLIGALGDEGAGHTAADALGKIDLHVEEVDSVLRLVAHETQEMRVRAARLLGHTVGPLVTERLWTGDE
jgi:hypothetical protein